MTREEFRTKIAEKGYLLLDGGTGSVLRTMGMPAGVSTEKWAYEHPEVIGELQRQYAQAGSDVIYAPTFAANRISLENMGIQVSNCSRFGYTAPRAKNLLLRGTEPDHGKADAGKCRRQGAGGRRYIYYRKSHGTLWPHDL